MRKAVKQRRVQDASRQRASRVSRRCNDEASGTQLLFLVLCPKRREANLSLFTKLRDHFVSRGIAVESVRRKEGIDLCKKVSVKRREVVTRFVRHDFALHAKRAFAADSKLRFVVFVEDDCRWASGITAQTIADECARAGDRIAWLGYGLRKQEPKVGAHAVGFSRSALECFRTESRRECSRRVWAMDTLLHKLWQQGFVHLPAKSLAMQAGHNLKGRH